MDQIPELDGGTKHNIPVRKEHASPKQYMRPVTSEPFESLQQRRINPSCTKLFYELIVINCLLLSVFGDPALDVPGGDDLLMRVSIGHGFHFRRGGGRLVRLGSMGNLWSCYRV